MRREITETLNRLKTASEQGQDELVLQLARRYARLRRESEPPSR